MLNNPPAASSSTPPSRKRSKWDTQEVDDEDQTTMESSAVKRRTKPKTLKAVESFDSQSQHSHTQVLYTRSRSSHSKFVPDRSHHPQLSSSRSVYSYERLNQIEEGSYGVVFRAKDKRTGDVVALKKLKLEEEKYGFPITALREINALISCKHDNVVAIREVVVGDTLTQYVRCIVVCTISKEHYTQSIHCHGLRRA